MRTLIHLSDLHFGRVDPMIVTPLLDFIRTINPSLAAISGDLTQRARTREFQLVGTYRTRILEKLNLKNNAELMRYVMERELS